MTNSKIMSLFDENEPSVISALVGFQEYIKSNTEFDFIDSIRLVSQYSDEPKFWYFSANYNSSHVANQGLEFNGNSSGFSFYSVDYALLKCVAETIERYCNNTFLQENVSYIGSTDNFSEKVALLNLDSIVRFSPKQLLEYKFNKFGLTPKSIFQWTECDSLLQDEKVLVPSQLIYLSYSHLSDEPIIYPSISTGAAGGSSLSAAIVRGILEVIERDAFMVFYLNKLPAPRINIMSLEDDRIAHFIEISERYDLEIICLNITTDIGVPTVVSLVFDKTGIGKAVSLGLKSSLNQLDAILGSIEEAFHPRTWIRREHEKFGRIISKKDLMAHSSMLNRGLFWYGKNTISNLDFWINTKLEDPDESINIISNNSGQYLKQILMIMKNLGYSMFYRSLMIPEFADLGYHVVKVLIPELQPLYLNENYPLLGGKRLLQVPRILGYSANKEFNNIPHPFL